MGIPGGGTQGPRLPASLQDGPQLPSKHMCAIGETGTPSRWSEDLPSVPSPSPALPFPCLIRKTFFFALRHGSTVWRIQETSKLLSFKQGWWDSKGERKSGSDSRREEKDYRQKPVFEGDSRVRERKRNGAISEVFGVKCELYETVFSSPR